MMIATLAVVLLLLEGSAAWSDDISCLKSLKNSVDDPDGRLEQWNFDITGVGFICTFVGISCWNDRDNKLISIQLSDMGLRGQFPAASLRNCSSLNTLDLSGNDFSGPIPSDIHLILPYLVSLHLSHNNFTGFVPPSIANLRYLNTLQLGDNGLTGPLPTSYTNDLEINFENNRGLCGHPFKACHTVRQQTMPLPPFFHGILTGWAVSMALVFSICLYALPERYVHMLAHWIDKKMKKKPQESLLKAQSEMNTLKVSKMEKYAARIPFAQLKEATSNFNQENVIGIGMRGRSLNNWLAP